MVHQASNGNKIQPDDEKLGKTNPNSKTIKQSKGIEEIKTEDLGPVNNKKLANK